MAKMKTFKWILGTLVVLLVYLALVDQVTTRVFGFDLLLWLAFGNIFTSQVYAWVVAIIGAFGILAIIGMFLFNSNKK